MKFRVLELESKSVLKVEVLTRSRFGGTRWKKYALITASELLKHSTEAHSKVYDAVQERDMGYLLPLIKEYILSKEKSFEPEVLAELEIAV